MRWRVIIALISIYGVYLLVGAAVFYSLEYTHEEQKCQESLEELKKYNLTTSKQSGNDSENTFGSVKEFVQLILAATQNGVQFDSSSTPSCAHNWNYQNAFFFAGTVITTIGYGNISPSTTGGRVFCIFYAIIGLPLFGIMFSEIGGKFASVFKSLNRRMLRKGRKTILRRCFVLFATITTMCVFCLLIPSIIFAAVENWTYFESFYYSVITLTTIGFGDFVVGTNPDLSYVSIYRIAVYFWILFGLAFMAAVLSLVGDIIKGQADKSSDSDDKSSSDEEEQESDGNDVEDGVERGKELNLNGVSGSHDGLEEVFEKGETLENKPAVIITNDEDTCSIYTNDLVET